MKILVKRNNTRRHLALSCAFALLTGLLVTSLSGCQSTGEGGFVPIPQQEIDLAPTNELVIYIPGYNFMIADIQPAILAYKEKYPEVNVIIETIAYEPVYPPPYTQRVNTEMMAGTGPDVIFAFREFFPDLYKTMDSGAFLNLTSIMDGDEEFNMEDYYQPVLDAGLYKGGRYIVPYCFQLPVITALQSGLEESGFDMSKSKDAVSFFDELVRCLPTLEENWRYHNAISEISYFPKSLYYAGIELIDYENREVLPDEDALKAFCEAYKPYAKTDFPKTADTISWENFNGYEHLAVGNSLFALADAAHRAIYLMKTAITFNLSNPAVLSSIPSMDGGLNALMESSLAIRSTSKNQLNAWNFIKIMLSEEIQQGKDLWGPIGGSYPVNRKTLQTMVNYFNEMSSYNPNNKEITERSLTPEEIQPYYDLLDGITGCSIGNNTVFYDNFLKIMFPYFTDEKSYNECVTELKRKLQLYLDE